MNERDLKPFLFTSLVALFLTLNFSGWFQLEASPKASAVQLLPEQKEMLLKEYETAVREIEIRIQQEHDLFTNKIIFVGIVLGSVGLAQSSFGRRPYGKEISQGNEDANLKTDALILCCWAAVAVAGIIDMRLVFNSVIIKDHGQWIQLVEESILGQTQAVVGWETYFSKQSILWERIQSMMILMDRRLLTFVLFVTALYISFSKSDMTFESSERQSGKRIGLEGHLWWLIGFCLGLMALPDLYAGLNLFLVNSIVLLIALEFAIRWSRKATVQNLADRGNEARTSPVFPK